LSEAGLAHPLSCIQHVVKKANGWVWK